MSDQFNGSGSESSSSWVGTGTKFILEGVGLLGILYCANLVHTAYSCVSTQYEDAKGDIDFKKLHKHKISMITKLMYGIGWPLTGIVEYVCEPKPKKSKLSQIFDYLCCGHNLPYLLPSCHPCSCAHSTQHHS